jgi:hypothetical protein
MATFSVTTSAAQDKALQYVTNQINSQRLAGDPAKTVLEVAREAVDTLFSGVLTRVRNEIRVDRGDLYNRASDADQATIDAILNQYR